MAKSLPAEEPTPVRPEGVPEGSILRVLRVPAEAAGQRLDVFVHRELKRTSRTRVQRIVEKSAFDAKGRRLRSNDRVREGDRVLLWREPFEGDEEQPALPVLYEDEHLLVIDKPALVAVHPTARYHKHTVIERLRADHPREFFALIHRIDRETSGILLVARNAAAERAFKRVLEDRTLGRGKQGVEKSYLALTRGTPANGDIELPLELDVDSSLRVKMRVAAPGTGLESKTSVTVLDAGGGYALVQCELHTGRQHQIRVHLSAAGCPIVGDKLYGPDDRLLARAADGELTAADHTLLELPRHALHAHRYSLEHAVTRQPLELVAPLPADLRAFFDRVKSGVKAPG
jgi:23S rRNA pseudouridine1911/1915/1917 synthase